MARIRISRATLSWAIERSSLPLEALTQRFPKLGRWLAGQEQPTLKQLEEFARATSTPFGFLFLERPPEEHLPIPFFRTASAQTERRPSANLLDTLYTMQSRQEWMREYLMEQGHEPLPFVASAAVEQPAQEIAARIRETLNLNSDWASGLPTWTDALRHLRAALEEVGVIVAANSIVGNNTHRKLDVEEFRGFVLVDEHAPLVFVNASDAKAAQMFTLAHEAAHIWYGKSAAFDLRDLQPATDAVEQACNRVAAEFLVPEADILDYWSQARRDAHPFDAIARQFKVSSLVAARRALDLGLVTRDEFFGFYNSYLERAHRKVGREGGDFYAAQTARIGRNLARAVLTAVREGKMLYREAYELTGLHGEIFERFAEHLERAA